MMRDLSEDGFALRAMIPLNQGDQTPFSFLLNESFRIEGEGRIVWVEDKGRLAGIQFTNIPSHAKQEIQSWLSGFSDTPDSRESDEEPVPPTAQTFDQLRDEIRSAPSRESPAKQSKTRWPISPPDGPVVKPPPGLEIAGQSKVPETSVPDSEDPIQENEPKHSPEPIPFPTLPSFSAARNTDPGQPEISSGVREILEKEFQRAGATPVSSHTVPEDDIMLRPGPPPELPDISEILMQPSRRAANSSYPSLLEPLDAPGRGMPDERRSRGFTLSRAVTVMFVLACVVAAAVYHDALGQGLIWLGQRMSGSQATSPAPAINVPSANENVSTPAANQQLSIPSDSSTQAPNAPAQEPTQQDSNASVTHSNTPPTTLPAVTPNPSPPVAPLSGISSSTSAESGVENGQAEYAKAMQLLHGNGATRDSSEAVRLLWISVEKGNPSAELTLADLYWRGEGVARNCDQTRILLGAAVRKGNADAQKRLQQFQREGCE